ncbi:MAG: type 4a pilus biogenesis protein PilO [Dehalococcoidia bacterium]
MAFGEQLEAIPSQYRWAMIPGILVLLGVAYWYFLYQPWAEEVARLERQITEKSRTLEEHRRIAAKYDEFKAKVEELEDKLRVALVRLPKRKEIPDLIRQISDLGVDTGLQISLLRPQAEQPKEFYAAVPITVKVIGTYHAVGQFFDALGRLTRLVSVSNVQMTLNAKVLETQCLATTFRFFEEGEGSASKGG